MSSFALEKLYQSGIKLTPMMAQYYEIKKEHRDDIVFFRMGDFYEVFFEDAKDVSKILNIALTHRGKLGETPVPMAGIPHHAANNYIDKLSEAGRRVAVCEQVQDPKDAVGIVKRAVTQVVSPGLPYDLSKVSDEETFFIASAFKKNNSFYITLLDYSTGDFVGHIEHSEDGVIDLLSKINIKELVTFPAQWGEDSQINEYLDQTGILKSIIAKEYFNPKNNKDVLEQFIPNYLHDQVIKDNAPILWPTSALTNFIHLTQKPDEIRHIKPFRVIKKNNNLYISSKSLFGLEILPSRGRSDNFSLYDFVKKTQTPMGARLLKSFFYEALTEKDQILLRQNVIQHLIQQFSSLEELSETLEPIRDIDRLLTKISTGKYIPQDLLSIAQSLSQFSHIKNLVSSFGKNEAEYLLKDLPKESKLNEIDKLISEIKRTINDEIGASLEKRNLILNGVNKKRDQLHELYTNSEEKFSELEKKYLELTGIPKIKIKHNNIHGYFVEVSKLHSDKVPAEFTRRQTLVQSERYVTTELTALEQEVNEAGDKLREVESKILKTFIDEIIALNNEIKLVTNVIAEIDVFHSLAKVAVLEDWTKPEITEFTFSIKGGWHPLIKKSTKGSFVNHDLNLDTTSFFGLITGPNMAGKTTVMREMAIIQLLAQMGSFVPAQKATIGICDKIFSRLGASDNIQEGQSTFMVEMSETAEIIRHATSKSLIILDEIGRGTSTYDGLSIAWSLVEYLVKKLKAKTLFATHYHELIELIDELEGAKNLTVEAKGDGENVKFLYRLIEEGANQSYGIYVAKLAGLPRSILNKATTKLKELEKLNDRPNDQLDFWNANEILSAKEPDLESTLAHEEEMAIDQLNTLDLNNMTPIQAFEKLRELQDMTNKNMH